MRRQLLRSHRAATRAGGRLRSFMRAQTLQSTAVDGPALAEHHWMSISQIRSILSTTSILGALALTACGGSTPPPPKSTITTRSETITTDDTGDKSKTAVQVTHTQQADGTQTTDKVEHQSTVVAPAKPSNTPAPKSN